MGHVQYFLQYKHQPVVFRDGANPGNYRQFVFVFIQDQNVYVSEYGAFEGSSP